MSRPCYKLLRGGAWTGMETYGWETPEEQRAECEQFVEWLESDQYAQAVVEGPDLVMKRGEEWQG